MGGTCRIYTGNGDKGKTTLGDGRIVSKTHPRVVATGCVDELNAVLGVCLTVSHAEPTRDWLKQIQRDLFDLGTDLSCGGVLAFRITNEHVARLEQWIDEVTEQLSPLTQFVLPGGTSAAAYLHWARTVCRRTELAVWQLAEQEPINDWVPTYLNRLSDLLFVLARLANNYGQSDELWIPKPDS